MRLGALVPAALVLTAAVFATAGCGTGNISPESVADAAQATIDAGGSRIAFNATFTAEGKRIPMTGTGVQDSKGKRGRLVLDVSRAFAGRKLPKGVDRADLRFEEVFDDPAIYMRSPLFQGELPKGKRWIKIDAAKLSQGLGTESVSSLGRDNPSDTLGYVRGIGDVSKDGTDRIRGVKCTHYRGTIDLRKVPERLPAAERRKAEQGVERIIKLSGGKSTRSVDVWVDGKKLVRRLHDRYTVSLKPGQSSSVEETIDFFDFGTTAVVRVPPSSQVEDVTRQAVSGVRSRTG